MIRKLFVPCRRKEILNEVRLATVGILMNIQDKPVFEDAIHLEKTIYEKVLEDNENVDDFMALLNLYASRAEDIILLQEKNRHKEQGLQSDAQITIELPQIESINQIYKCRHCKSAQVTVESVQTRSIDEPASIFITCQDCKYVYRM